MSKTQRIDFVLYFFLCPSLLIVYLFINSYPMEIPFWLRNDFVEKTYTTDGTNTIANFRVNKDIFYLGDTLYGLGMYSKPDWPSNKSYSKTFRFWNDTKKFIFSKPDNFFSIKLEGNLLFEFVPIFECPFFCVRFLDKKMAGVLKKNLNLEIISGLTGESTAIKLTKIKTGYSFRHQGRSFYFVVSPHLDNYQTIARHHNVYSFRYFWENISHCRVLLAGEVEPQNFSIEFKNFLLNHYRLKSRHNGLKFNFDSYPQSSHHKALYLKYFLVKDCYRGDLEPRLHVFVGHKTFRDEFHIESSSASKSQEEGLIVFGTKQKLSLSLNSPRIQVENQKGRILEDKFIKLKWKNHTFSTFSNYFSECDT